MKPVHRTEIVKLLDRWKQGKASAEDVRAWAEERFNSEEYEVSDAEDAGSIASETLALLEMLDIHLICEDDVPALVKLLETPDGEFENGFGKWQEYFRTIDFQKRAQDLKQKAPYSNFCR